MTSWISVDERLPGKGDGWIGHVMDMHGQSEYYIRVLACESGGYGRRINIRQFFVLLIGKWTMDNDECEIAAGSFMDTDASDWPVSHWMPLPDFPSVPDPRV